MPVKSSLNVPIPNLDLTSFLLDGIPPRSPQSCNDTNFTDPFLFSAERPESKNLSLIEFKHLVKCFASGLKRENLQEGDHVMLVSPNYIQTMIIALGTIAAGGVYCTAQPDLKVREYRDQFLRDEPRFLFVCNEHPMREYALRAWESVNGDPRRSWLVDECITLEERGLEITDTLPKRKYWTDLFDYDGGPTFQWKRLSTELECRRPCMLFTTSGTTGLRKAAMFSHRNLVAAWTGTGYRAQYDATKLAKLRKPGHPGEVSVRILHTVSVSRALGTCLPLAVSKSRRHKRIEVYFMSKTYVDMTPYLDTLQQLRITDVSCAPFTLARLFASQKDDLLEKKHNFSHLRSVTAAGAPTSQITLNRARKFLFANGAPATLRVERALGITEAGSLVSSWHMADAPDLREGCQGRLEPNMEAKIMTYGHEDEESTAQEVTTDKPGEIWLRGPSFIDGYYKNETATRDAFTANGWFKSGDIGYFQAEKLFLLDRKKDILKTPNNIPPSYIESVLLDHPSILDAGVVGIYQPSQELQLIRAYIVKRSPSQTSEQDVAEWMERESADTAHLTGGVEFLDELPRNSAGKLLRRSLRERARQTFRISDLRAMTLSHGHGAVFRDGDKHVVMVAVGTGTEAEAGKAARARTSSWTWMGYISIFIFFLAGLIVLYCALGLD